jgi:LSD1 subclass zinc finger protein
MSNHPCEGCKADLKWSPGADAMACPYCGTVTQVTAPGASTPQGEGADANGVPSTVVEHDLDAALVEAPRGWGGEVAEFRCSQCAAFSAVEAHVTVSACAFCGTTQLEVQPAANDHFRPESLLPFAIEEKRARGDFSRWVGSLRFRPNDLKRMSKLDGLKGVYVPIFTFDVKTQTHWSAQAGYYYYVEVSDGQGGTKQERRIRWEPVSGVINKNFDDWMVSASSGLSQALFQGLLPYNTDALVPYDSRFLAGFVAERYQLSLNKAWETGFGGMEERITSAVRSAIPGDTNKGVSQRIQHWDRTFKHCLLPVWIAAYRYKEKTYHYVVNGVTGKMSGTAPWSWFKIIGTVLLILGVIAGLVAFLES